MSNRSWNIFSKLQSIFSSSNANNAIQDLQTMTQGVNFSLLSSYLMNAYRFDGLPEEIDQNHLWALVTEFSSVVVFKNEYGKWLVLPYQKQQIGKQNNLNYLGYPSKVTARDYNQRQYTIVTDGILTDKEKHDKNVFQGVILFISNSSRFYMDLHLSIQYYATKMSKCDNIMANRLNYHGVPVMYGGDDQQKLSFEKMFSGMANDKPFFLNSKDFNSDVNASVIMQDFKYINAEIYAEKNLYKNEFLTYWGIRNNKNDDKKERMIVDEVNINVEEILTNRANVINSLEDFNQRLKKIFDIDVKVRYENDLMEYNKEYEYEDMEEKEQEHENNDRPK